MESILIVRQADCKLHRLGSTIIIQQDIHTKIIHQLADLKINPNFARKNH